jgi:hypothetical protein
MNEFRLEIIRKLAGMIREEGPSAEDPTVTLVDRKDIIFSNIREQQVFLVEGLSNSRTPTSERKYPDHYYTLSKSAQNRFRKRNKGKY